MYIVYYICVYFVLYGLFKLAVITLCHLINIFYFNRLKKWFGFYWLTQCCYLIITGTFFEIYTYLSLYDIPFQYGFLLIGVSLLHTAIMAFIYDELINLIT